RVHRLPESGMRISGNLAITGQCLQRIALPDGGIALDVVEHAVLQDEKAAVYPRAIARGLFLEAGDPVVLDVDGTEAARWLHRAHRGESGTSPVKGQLGRDVDVGETVAVGEAERLAIQIICNPL